MIHVLRSRRLAIALAAGLITAGLTLSASAAASQPKARDGLLAISSFDTGQIYTLAPDGSRFRQITHVPEGTTAAFPNWSPDGRRIAFVGDGSGIQRLYTMAADGTGQHLVFTDAPGFRNFAPHYTPDGQRLVFARCQPDDGDCAIYSVRLDGTHLTSLTAFPAPGASDFWPAVAPDGRIAFSRFGAGGISSQVYVMNADGSHVRAISAPILQAVHPSWSPDSRRVAIATNCCKLGGNIWALSSTSNHADQLTETPYPLFDLAPAYSPSGTRIAFVSSRNHPDRCCSDLFVMSADGHHETMVSTGITVVDQLAWGTAPIG